jgi:uncharacterized membrane protein
VNLGKFRRQLRQEADRWLAEELIERNQYEQLAERYSFNTLDVNARDNFAIILIGLGGVLLGLGVITFVAANWQAMSREWRAGLLFVALIGSNLLGFCLWQYTQRWQRLGQGILLLGAFIMGANIALIGQIFHVGGPLDGLLYMWSFGVLAMAYSLRFKPLGIISIILIGWGYWSHNQYWNTESTDPLARAIAENMLVIVALLFVPLAYWCRSRTIGILSILLTGLAYLNQISNQITQPAPFEQNFVGWMIIEYMPIVSVCLFIPLAYRLRSRLIFVGAALGIMVGLCRSIVILIDFNLPWYFTGAISTALLPALLWVYDDALLNSQWLRWMGSRPNALGALGALGPRPLAFKAFKPLAQGLAIVVLTISCYSLSFYGAWGWRYQDTSQLPATFQQWPSLVNALLFTGITLVSWLQRSRQVPDQAQNPLNVVLVLCAIVSLPIFWHGALGQIPEIATFTYNALLFLLAVGLIRESLEKSHRLPFWSGIFLLFLQIISRLFEYNTELLLKASVLALCGIGVIVSGLWFERHMQASHPNASNIHLPSSTEDRS